MTEKRGSISVSDNSIYHHSFIWIRQIILFVFQLLITTCTIYYKLKSSEDALKPDKLLVEKVLANIFVPVVPVYVLLNGLKISTKK